jgi:uncharacterized 2Fe-2S/4Fe-4S cluster protein (DUF4445 family)
MKARELTVERPGGQVRKVRLPEDGAGQSLAAALEAAGFPLNMRCGGRGLCKGCRVVLAGPGGTVERRACQCAVADLDPAVERIRIPENSWRDHSLHGVSVFEIRVATPAGTEAPEGHGLALDIGTTTVAGALWEFPSGRCLGTASLANGQARYGDNVLSRISYTLENENGPAELQAALVEGSLRPLLERLCAAAGLDPAVITAANAAGNPAMLHTLAGVSLEGLARYPFKPAFLGARRIDARAIGLDADFPIELLPGLGPFVGADIASGALAAGMLEAEAPVLLIDFGTNGEILLKHPGGYLATATAAGPAFEGGRLSCGAAARDGVISALSRENGEWRWRLSGSGEGRPTGISGAAYIDFLAIGVREGWLRPAGRFDPGWREVITVGEAGDAERRIPLDAAVHVSEVDVAELQQAKAAIAAGVATLLELAGVRPEELRTVFVAGGFGYHLRPDNGIAIGLLPEVPVERIEIIGNASLGGASLLLNPAFRDQIDALEQACETVELNQTDCFEDHFTDALALEPM